MPFIRRHHLLSRIRQLSEEHTMSHLRIACGFVTLLVVIAGSGWVAMAALPLRMEQTTILPMPSVHGLTNESLQPGAPVAPAVGDQPASSRTEAERAAMIAYLMNRALHLAEQARNAQHARGDQPLTVHIATPPVVPTVLQRVEPVYPEAAKGHGVEATVHLRVTVGTAGEVTNVEVIRTRLTTERDVTDPTFWASQPSRLFGQAAEDAVRQWRFEASSASRRFELPVSFGENQMVFVPIGRAGHAPMHVVNGTPAETRFAPAAAQADKPARIRVGGAIRQPHLVSKVESVYPPAAKAARVQGVVILEIVIGTEGTVKEAIVLRSIPLLDQAALDAVVQWKYEPTLLNGAPAEVISTVVVNFALP
jgi:protein TonB